MTTYKVQTLDVPGANWGTTAQGVNDLGQITGEYQIGIPGNPYDQAYIMTPGSAGIISLGGDPYGQHSDGYDINNRMEMAGQSGHYESTARGFVRHVDGSFTRLEYTID